jgi:hypothetical protein
MAVLVFGQLAGEAWCQFDLVLSSAFSGQYLTADVRNLDL